jgi:hypothetical protein
LTKDGAVKDSASFDEPELEVLAGPTKTKVLVATVVNRVNGGPRAEPTRRK